MIGVRRAGEHGVLLELPDNAAAVRLAHRLASEPGLVDVVPGHRTVLVTWEDERPELIKLAEAALGDDEAATIGAFVEIPVRYDGPDLD